MWMWMNQFAWCRAFIFSGLLQIFADPFHSVAWCKLLPLVNAGHMSHVSSIEACVCLPCFTWSNRPSGKKTCTAVFFRQTNKNCVPIWWTLMNVTELCFRFCFFLSLCCLRSVGGYIQLPCVVCVVSLWFRRRWGIALPFTLPSTSWMADACTNVYDVRCTLYVVRATCI